MFRLHEEFLLTNFQFRPSIMEMWMVYTNKLDYTRGAGGPKGLVSNHLKSAWIGGNEEDGGKLKLRMDDARFSLFDTDYEIKPSEVVIFCW